MNRFLLFFYFLPIFSNTLYWDLGVVVLDNNISSSNTPIQLSTYHRIEGLKEYYINNFDNAIFHFEQLNKSDQDLVLYERLDSYYTLNKLNRVIDILSEYDHAELSDNIIYLKSKTLTMLGEYDEAVLLLNYIKEHFHDSDYSNIIIFDLEKINLLKK
tara:strand:+ start:181 stop:654 length:474 start_codon:yes stop_codon:yes gene_type:complete